MSSSSPPTKISDVQVALESKGDRKDQGGEKDAILDKITESELLIEEAMLSEEKVDNDGIFIGTMCVCIYVCIEKDEKKTRRKIADYDVRAFFLIKKRRSVCVCFVFASCDIFFSHAAGICFCFETGIDVRVR